MHETELEKELDRAETRTTDQMREYTNPPETLAEKLQLIRAVRTAVGQRNDEIDHAHDPAAVLQEAKEMYDDELLRVLRGVS